MTPTFCIKVDVDTERGTRIGVPNLVKTFRELEIPATFLFSLGPDNTGRAIKRIFRPGFLQKVNRTSVISTYGIKTLLNGILWPGPYIGQKHETILQSVKQQGFEVGIHAYDHERWQDNIDAMSKDEIRAEFNLAQKEFKRIFNEDSKTAGAPGWQTNAKALQIYDESSLMYASDCRGTSPFFPKISEHIYKTLQIPTTLPTLDELIGRPEIPQDLNTYYLSLVKEDVPNVMTVHAEIEGMNYDFWFKNFLIMLKQENIKFENLSLVAEKYLNESNKITVCNLKRGHVAGRSGLVTMQEI